MIIPMLTPTETTEIPEAETDSSRAPHDADWVMLVLILPVVMLLLLIACTVYKCRYHTRDDVAAPCSGAPQDLHDIDVVASDASQRTNTPELRLEPGQRPNLSVGVAEPQMRTPFAGAQAAAAAAAAVEPHHVREDEHERSRPVAADRTGWSHGNACGATPNRLNGYVEPRPSTVLCHMVGLMAAGSTPPTTLEGTTLDGTDYTYEVLQDSDHDAWKLIPVPMSPVCLTPLGEVQAMHTSIGPKGRRLSVRLF